ncbi:hypothetical protein HDU99_007940, partial [Rhizoclosmatium hyalinum]
NLSDNKITGRIPDEIGQLQLLENLDLSSNRMYGEIPKTIGQLKRLKVLQLQLNKFSGELPIELGNLPRIKSIYLNNNRFYGELNASIFEGLKTLSQLALNRNQFSGPFPTSFLSILRFRKLRLENNYFDTTPHWHEYPTHLKFSLRMGLKQYRFRPQKEGTPPQQILPDYTEFPEDTLHPSDTRRQSLGPLRTLYDLPDSVPLWTPEEVAFWVHTHGGPALVCELIQDLHIGGSQFFRLREDDLLSALGVRDEDQPPAYSALPFPDIDFSIDKVEPMLLLDTTASMHLPASDSPSSQSQSQQLTRIQLVQKSIGILVEKLSTVDSQAEFEQDSDGEGGGLRTVTFSGGSALDLGDLNPQNLGDKFAQINWEGSTLIVPGFTKLLDVYNEEFGDFGPSSRPKMVALVITDGEAQDINDLAVMILTMDFTNVYLVFALIGFGKDYENARVRLAELCKLNDHIRLFEMKQETQALEIANACLSMVR